MSDVSQALEANSDQLNATDIMGVEPVIRVREVKVTKSDQPVAVYFDGDNNRPWKPSKGMLRVLAAGWGRDSAAWIGKLVQIYHEPTVKYAGKEVGGIRIRGMSHIDKRGLNCTLTLNRQQRVPYPVTWVDDKRPEYPDERFRAALPKMAQMMQSGTHTLEQIVAQCQKTGDLTAEQFKQLEEQAPVTVDDEDGE